MNPNTKSFWDKKISEERIKLLKSPIYVHKNKVVVNLLLHLKGKLLDVGLGYGILENLLLEHAPRLDLFGIDISEISVREIKSKIKGKFIVADAKKIPFRINFFDCVIALDILEHFQVREMESVITELTRVLRKGGILIISVPLNETAEDGKLNKHLTFFSERSILSLLKSHDFEIRKTHQLYAFKQLYFVKSFLARYLKLWAPNLIIIEARKK